MKKRRHDTDINIFMADDINQVIEYLQDERDLPLVGDFKEFSTVELKKDFSDVKGSFTVKRAAQISAAGFHNLSDDRALPAQARR